MTTAQSTPFIGLTGSVAAGKSEALAALARLGAATLSSDAVVHELLGSDPIRELLVRRWGEEVAPQGVIDRSRVGEIVFGRPAELAWLESELHPRVGERIAAWRAEVPADAAAAVVEVPLLFETGMDAAFDATICVVADDTLRAERAGARAGGGLEGRESRQLAQAEKASRASYVVRNDAGIEELEAELSRVLSSISAAWRGPRR